VLKITVDDKQVKDLLSRLSQRAGNLSPIMRQIAGDMKDAVEENFETEGKSLGVPWTKSQRAAKQGGKTLRDTEILANSITKSNTATEAVVGTNIAYAAIHQFGGTIKQGARTNIYVQNRSKPILNERAAEEARCAAKGQKCSLATLYASGNMPISLVKAHAALDKAVDATCGYKGTNTDAGRVAFLFEIYEGLLAKQ
jgi:phage virion morphogenesis protein